MKVITCIQAFYEIKLQKTSDFENALMECEKEDLVEFIINSQNRQCFKEYQDKGDYNEEFTKIYGYYGDKIKLEKGKYYLNNKLLQMNK